MKRNNAGGRLYFQIWIYQIGLQVQGEQRSALNYNAEVYASKL